MNTENPIPATQETTVAQPPTDNLWERDTYTAPELRPYDCRPGAMDAFKLPSRGLA